MAGKAEPSHRDDDMRGFSCCRKKNGTAAGVLELEEESPEGFQCCCETPGGFRFRAVEQRGDFGGAFPLFFMQEVD